MTTSQISVSRRTLLGATAGAGALAAAGSVTFLSAPAEAAVAQAGKPMAGALRYKVGDLEITALLDGYLDVTPELVIGYEAPEGKRLRDVAMVEGEALRIPVNAYLVNAGDRLILVDAGTPLCSISPTLSSLWK